MRSHANQMLALWIAICWMLSATGCADHQYRYGRFGQTSLEHSKDPVIERGQPGKTLQRMAYILDSPARILHLPLKAGDREVSPHTTDSLRDYLRKNDLSDVYVCIHEYDPRGEWKRLRDNEMISPVWRYSMGTLNFVGYVLLPNPVFRTNRYNPYTNSLYVNSDSRVSALHAAAVAKDILSQDLPGTYAAITSLPGISLLRETNAVGDVVGYARAEQDWNLEKDAYRILYPEVGSESAFPAFLIVTAWWEAPLIGLLGRAAGQVAGQVVENRRYQDLMAKQEQFSRRTRSTEPADSGSAATEVQPANYQVEEPPERDNRSSSSTVP